MEWVPIWEDLDKLDERVQIFTEELICFTLLKYENNSEPLIWNLQVVLSTYSVKFGCRASSVVFGIFIQVITGSMKNLVLEVM